MGVREALPKMLDIFRQADFPCDFFTTAEVCQKHPDILREVRDRFDVGCHGLNHSTEFFCAKSLEWQMSEIGKAGEVISDILGKKPVMFRAPNFSANGDTIRVLKGLGYKLDSSVLPGRVVRKALFWKIIDFRKAPSEPYNPSEDDIRSRGTSPVPEVPVTENPFSSGAPIGLGYLNTFGLQKTLAAVERSPSPVIVFLIHPWELVDLSARFDKLLPWMLQACRSQPELLETFLTSCREKFGFRRLMDFI